MPDFGPLGSPTLSTFDGPDETPLSEGGKWAQTTPERDPMRLFQGDATDSVHGEPNYSHWVADVVQIPLGFRGEVFGCTAGGQLGAALETWRVFLFNQVGVNFYGYLVYVGGGIGKEFRIRRYDNGLI